MKRFILLCLLFGLLFNGCKTIPERQRVLEKGTFIDRIHYLESNYSSKREVVEFLGLPNKKKNFYDNSSKWHYTESTELPLEIIFGVEGRVLRIDIKSDSGY